MIAVYNLLNGKYDIDYSDFFTFSTTTHTRGHMFRKWVCAESEDDFKKLIDSNSINIMYSVYVISLLVHVFVTFDQV